MLTRRFAKSTNPNRQLVLIVRKVQLTRVSPATAYMLTQIQQLLCSSLVISPTIHSTLYARSLNLSIHARDYPRLILVVLPQSFIPNVVAKPSIQQLILEMRHKQPPPMTSRYGVCSGRQCEDVCLQYILLQRPWVLLCWHC